MPSSPSELSLTGRRWLWPEPIAAAPVAGIPPWVARLLARRGLHAPDEIERYLEPSLSSMEDPSLMADMDAAVQRLMTAIAAREPITIYGDYDVDGVCATTVLVELLRRVGADVGYYIPDRRAEGYGLNAGAVEEIAKHSRVLVTADCGITALDEIALARRLGLDVVVVDHHRAGDALPHANAVLDPHRPDCAFPFKGLCAAGVAFMLVVALRRRMREAGSFARVPEPDVRDLLDIVALATVADMVPIRGTNRTLVAAGLKRMSKTRRVGLAALMGVSEVDPSRVSATDLGFRLGPRINARGRLSHAAEAVELLLTSDPQRARILAGALDAANRERRRVEKSTARAAFLRMEQDGMDGAGIVLHDESWHPGVLGLVASRLVARYNRPAIVIGEGGKGSARSIDGLNVHDAIAEASEHLVRFGGHRAAAGVTIRPESVEPFRAAFAGAVRRRLGEPPFVPVLNLDLEVEPAQLGLDMLEELQRLAPFGQDNPEPLLVARALSIRSKRVVGDDHLKLSLGEGALDAIAFNLAPLAAQLPPVVDVAFRLERNSYRGRDALQLRVEDLKPAS